MSNPQTRMRQVAASCVALAVLLTACTGAPSTDPEPSADPTSGATLPDGQLVLFEWYPAGGDQKTIVVSNADLTAPAVEVAEPSSSASNVHADWAPERDRFAYEVLTNEGTSSIWVASADGSEGFEAIACDAEPCLQMSWPAWSADGSAILAVQYDLADNGDWGPSHLVVVELETGERTVLASTADGATAFYLPTWSPDGSQVAVHLESYPDAAETEITGSVVIVYDADPTTADVGLPITPTELFAGYAKWHPTEDRILFASWDLNAFQGDEASQLFEVRSDGSGLRQITSLDAANDGRPGEASWTPDGAGIIAAIGHVSAGSVDDVKIAYIDPTTGEVQRSMQSGAMPKLQPGG